METLASRESASSNTEPEIHLLLARDPLNEWRRWRMAGVVSLFAHLVLIAVLLLIPESATTRRVYDSKPITIVTPLYIPTELTQKAPNKGKLSKELTVEAAASRPAVKPAAPPPPVKPAPRSAPPPPPQVAKAEPKVVIAEPPKIQTDTPATDQVADQFAKLTQPLPAPPPNQQPKLALENIAPASKSPVQGNPGAKVTMPNTSIDAAVRDIGRTGALGAQSVSDAGADNNERGFGLNLPPSAGRPQSSMELKSDPMGVDFRPYMRQVIAAVKRNWLAVYPEAARRGQRGDVVLEFAIARQGLVTKIIMPGESGAKALDEGAIAAISASNPLPPLPKDFKGDRIVLRMTFMYNRPR
jgi:TonB family protein